MPADLRKVEHVAVQDDGRWFQVFAELLECPQRDALGAGPDMEVRADDCDAVLDIDAGPGRIFLALFRWGLNVEIAL